MGWFKDKKDQIEAIASLAAIVGVIASMVLSLLSLYYSSQATKETGKLKADAERVDLYFEAKFDHKQRIELIPADKKRRFPVLTLYAHLMIINLNPYRPIIIEGVEPSLVDGTMPSELGMRLMEGGEEGSGVFVVSSLSVVRKRARLSWPIDGKLFELTRLLLEKKPHITCGDFKLELGKHHEVVKASEKHRQLIFHLRTVPKRQDGKEFTTKLALF